MKERSLTRQQQTRRVALIVDDDEKVRSTLELLLQINGCETIAVEDVQHALKWIRNRHFDLIITDYEMDGETGIDLIRFVLADSRGAGQGIILFTGCGLDSEPIDRFRAEVLKEGYHVHFVEKGGSFERLEMVLNQVLSQNRPPSDETG